MKLALIKKQSHALNVLSFRLGCCDELTRRVVDNSPVTGDDEALNAYVETFDDEIKKLKEGVALARRNVVNLDLDPPDEWLTFPIEGWAIEIEGDALAWRKSIDVAREWKAIKRGISAARVRLDAATPPPRKSRRVGPKKWALANVALNQEPGCDRWNDDQKRAFIARYNRDSANLDGFIRLTPKTLGQLIRDRRKPLKKDGD